MASWMDTFRWIIVPKIVINYHYSSYLVGTTKSKTNDGDNNNNYDETTTQLTNEEGR